MASKNIKGITIEIGGDTSKLGDALKGAEQQSKGLAGELKSIERLLKLDPKNTDLLAQRQKVLADAVSNSKEKLETLKTAQEQAAKAFAEGKIGEDQYREITREVMWAERELKGLEQRLSDVNNKWKSAAKDVAAFGDKAKSISQELSQVNRLLKLDPKNTELLAQKQKLLADAVSNSKEKLETLKTAQEQAAKAFAEGKIGEDQYREITREVMWAEQELKGLEQRLSDVNNKWKSAAKDVAAFGDKATNLGNKLMPVSAAAGAAVGGIVALAVNAGAAADDLNTLSKQTGISTEDLQKFKYAADTIDVPLETFTGSLAKLTKNMANAQMGTSEAGSAFSALGLDIAELGGGVYTIEELEKVYKNLVKTAVDGKGDKRFAAQDALDSLGISLLDLQQKKPAELFNKFVDNAEKAADITNKQAIAFDGLGISITDVNGNLRDNEEVFYEAIDALGKIESETQRDAIAMQLFGKSAQDLNPLILGGADALKVLGQEAEDAGLIMSQDALDGLNAFNDEIDKTKAQATAAGMKLGAAFGEVLLPLLKSLAEWLQKVAQWFSNLSPGMAKLILIVLAVVAAIGPLLIFVGMMASGIAALMPVITGLGTVFAVLTGPIGLVIAAIAAVIAIGVLLYKNWDKIIAFAANLKDQLSAKFAQIKETIVTKISDAMAFIRELPAKALQWGKDIVNGLWNGIKSLAGTLKSNVSKFISDNVPGVVKKLLGINSPSKLFEGMGVNVVEGFSKGIEGTTKNLRNAASSMASAATVGASSSTVRHTFDPLTVRGVNNQGELVAVVERTMKDILYWEGR